MNNRQRKVRDSLEANGVAYLNSWGDDLPTDHTASFFIASVVDGSITSRSYCGGTFSLSGEKQTKVCGTADQVLSFLAGRMVFGEIDNRLYKNNNL